jgi:hypothetical protein
VWTAVVAAFGAFGCDQDHSASNEGRATFMGDVHAAAPPASAPPSASGASSPPPASSATAAGAR